MRQRRLAVSVLALAAAALACGAPAGGGTSNDNGNDNGDEPTARPSTVLFEDDFEDDGSGWDTGEDDDGLVEYRDGAYVFAIQTPDLFVWGNAGASGIQNAAIEVTARNVGDADDGPFGVICNYQDDEHFHYLGVSPDGYYAIIRYEDGEDVFLTSDSSQWESSDAIEINVESYAIVAECGSDGTLTLSVDGQEVASARDDIYSDGGDIGLFVWTFEKTPLEVHFDNVRVTELD